MGIKYGNNLRMSEDKLERLERVYNTMNNHCDVKNSEIFNSGYEGITFTVNVVKIFILEQPGKVGLEDHSVGYLELRVDGEEIHKFRHKAKHFGDVDLNEDELEHYYYEIMLTLQGL